jgi:hypothetical protein
VDEDIILGGMAILFTGMVVLVPILGLTLRFAIKPFFDTWAEIQRNQLRGEQDSVQSRQLNLLEAELAQVQHALRAVQEGQDFQRQLADPLQRR